MSQPMTSVSTLTLELEAWHNDPFEPGELDAQMPSIKSMFPNVTDVRMHRKRFTLPTLSTLLGHGGFTNLTSFQMISDDPFNPVHTNDIIALLAEYSPALKYLVFLLLPDHPLFHWQWLPPLRTLTALTHLEIFVISCEFMATTRNSNSAVVPASLRILHLATGKPHSPHAADTLMEALEATHEQANRGFYPNLREIRVDIARSDVSMEEKYSETVVVEARWSGLEILSKPNRQDTNLKRLGTFVEVFDEIGILLVPVIFPSGSGVSWPVRLASFPKELRDG
ncbi:hypothetical protein B0T16DRAFT_395801 [Cercophora newfieldiana]|uniref:Uncharacterized protein n=1 Tax=Cercophora newfieldiana TaxID=92897 RepID=A0AA39YNJ1_9PEZI|nr:hypothetical protein B0T16DRAFT_395801 [Cercophora newfieldiana]